MQETIYALATAAGRAGVAVIRISGNKSAEALASFGLKPLPSPRVATLSKLYSGKILLDDALVIWFPAPHSFTGEDIAELHTHGGRAVINAILEHLSGIKGLRSAEAGEFSRRAFENGKMDLTQAEGLADLVEAETEAQRKQALRQMEGGLLDLYEEFRSSLIEILAHLEAYIDFPDEDIPPNTAKEMQKEVENLKNKIEKHLANSSGEILREGLHAAIIGAPNVGKSSIMNWLAKRDIAIVSSLAGTTRDVIEARLDIGGFPLTLSDTAGLRESSDEIESEGIKRALFRAENADLKICVFDANLYPELDKSTLDLVDENSLVILNKSDLSPALPSSPEIAGREAIAISATTGKNMEKLLEKMQEELANRMEFSAEPVVTRQRHRAGLNECLEYLEKFLIENKDIELQAEDLRRAAQALGKLTGRIDVEDILDKIFSSFCIGK